jgi:hypothetical protein
MENNGMPLLGDKFPKLEVVTTRGRKFYQTIWLGNGSYFLVIQQILPGLYYRICCISEALW